MPSQHSATGQGAESTDITPADLAKVARTRVFFGHQSVGKNILDAVPDVFRDHGLPAPSIEQDATSSPASEGCIAHGFIGRNEQPLTKIRDFDAKLRARGAAGTDVAMMKLCYIDVTSGTDVDALFTVYRDTMAALAADYPSVTFLPATVPLMSEPGLLGRLKTRLTGNDRYGVAENVVRERLNAVIRAEYGTGPLFDLAAIESTAPDGTRVSGTSRGRGYFALYEGYTTDRGHLNALGSQRAAVAWLRLVAQVSPR